MGQRRSDEGGPTPIRDVMKLRGYRLWGKRQSATILRQDLTRGPLREAGADWRDFGRLSPYVPDRLRSPPKMSVVTNRGM